MNFEICAATDTGCSRKNNEDGFYFNKIGCYEIDECFIYRKISTPLFLFVTDGVGGTQVGEEATRSCINTAYDFLTPYDDNELVNLIDNINRNVCNLTKNMDTACTIAGLLISDDNLYCFNVGDSRIYSISQGFLNQLSVDDTVSGLSGEIAERKEPLLQYIGKCGLIPHIKELSDISTFLICTDGLTDMLSLDEIEDIFKEKDIRHVASELMSRAKHNGGLDNITFIIIKPLKEGETNG